MTRYVSREGRDLYVSNRGLQLVDQIREMGIDILASPEMTGEWEYKLKQMEHGQLERETFMAGIRRLTGEVVETAKNAARESLQREYPPFPVPCPVCGTPELKQDEGRYKCGGPGCGFTLPKILANRPLSEAEARKLLTSKLVGPLTGFLSKFKKPFDAMVELREDPRNGLKAAFVFEKTAAEEEEAAAIQPENELCPCPVCGQGKIHETPTSYVCSERARGGSCRGRLSKEMCKYMIPREQAVKFFAEGKTDLIEKFISKKGRPFAAHLRCNPKGKRILEWDFPPREPKKKASKK